MADVLSFGTMNTAQNRFFWRGAYNAGTIYNAYDVVSYLGSAYIALSTQTGVLPTNTGSWDQMTSAGAVTSVAGRVGNVVLSSADLSDGVTGTGAVVLNVNPSFPRASAAGFAMTVSGSAIGQATIDMSGGTGGTGGFVQSTNDASTTTGYGTWITNNAWWNGTSWIQPRGTGTSSLGFTANNHKGFSFNRAAATGINNSGITWTEVANISANGVMSVASGYQIAGVALAASNLSDGVTGTGAVVLASSPTITAANSQSNAVISVRARSGTGNGFEFGHSNAAGFGSTIGFEVTSGAPFVGFCCEAGTTANTYRTRGNIGQIMKQVPSTTAPTISFGHLASNNADNQSFVTDATISAGGVVSAVTGYQVNGAATSGNVLRGNGTNFVSAQLAAADLSNGVTGSGNVVLATSPSLTTPKIGTETISASPRMTWGIDFIANGNSTSGTFKQWVLDKAITITRIDVVYAGTVGLGGTTACKLRVTDGTTNTDVNNTNGAGSDTTGAISVNYAAGATLQIKTVAGAGYTQNPTNLTVTVQYKMQ